MTDPTIEALLNKIRSKMTLLKENRFFGNINIEVNHKDGGITSVYLEIKEKIL